MKPMCVCAFVYPNNHLSYLSTIDSLISDITICLLCIYPNKYDRKRVYLVALADVNNLNSV